LQIVLQLSKDLNVTALLSHKLLNIGVGRIFEKHGSSSEIKPVDEILPGKPEHVHRHLAGDKLHSAIDAQLTQLLDGRNTFVLEDLFHQARRKRIETGNVTDDQLGNRPVIFWKSLFPNGIFIGIAGLLCGEIFASIFLFRSGSS